MFTEQLPFRRRGNGIAGCALPLPVEQEDWVAAFHIYADASGKLSKSDYTPFCGFVGHVSEWSTVTQEWDNCRFKWQVPPIHMAKIEKPERDAEWLKIQTQWGNDWQSRKNAMLEDFAAGK